MPIERSNTLTNTHTLVNQYWAANFEIQQQQITHRKLSQIKLIFAVNKVQKLYSDLQKPLSSFLFKKKKQEFYEKKN